MTRLSGSGHTNSIAVTVQPDQPSRAGLRNYLAPRHDSRDAPDLGSPERDRGQRMGATIEDQKEGKGPQAGGQKAQTCQLDPRGRLGSLRDRTAREPAEDDSGSGSLSGTTSSSGPPTWSTISSPPNDRTGCEWPSSPTCAPLAALGFGVSLMVALVTVNGSSSACRSYTGIDEFRSRP